MFKKLLKSQGQQRLIMWVIVITVVLPMILFFQGGLANHRGPGGTAGIIFGKSIPWDTFEEERRFVYRTITEQLGDIPEGLEPILNEQAWNRLILREEARRRYQVSDKELAERLHQEPAFRQGGRFLPDLYFRWVRGMGMTPQQFEARLKDDIRIQRLLDSVQADVSVTEDEVRKAYDAQRGESPPDDAQFAKDHDAIRDRVLAAKRGARVNEWLQSLRDQAHLQSFVGN